MAASRQKSTSNRTAALAVRNDPSMTVSLLVISDREPLLWLLTEQRWALTSGRASKAPAEGDELLLYTTRGCYRNPTRDRGLVMGRATVTSEPKQLHRPVVFRDREFSTGFSVDVTGVAALHTGVELAPLAGSLSFLPDPATWSVRLRRSLIPLDDDDAATVSERLDPLLRPREKVLTDYQAAAKLSSSPQMR